MEHSGDGNLVSAVSDEDIRKTELQLGKIERLYDENKASVLLDGDEIVKGNDEERIVELDEGKNDNGFNSCVASENFLEGKQTTTVAQPKELVDRLFPAEKTWLTEYPQSEEWYGIKQRVMAAKLVKSSESAKAEDFDARLFLRNNQEAIEREHNKFSIIESGAKIGKNMGYELLNEVVGEMLRELCDETLKISDASSSIVHRIIVKALTNETEHNKRFLKLSGRQDVLLGCLSDFKKQHHSKVYNDKLVFQNMDVSITQALFSGEQHLSAQQRREKAASERRKWKQPVDATIYLDEQESGNDYANLLGLVRATEMKHFDGFVLQSAGGSPLLTPAGCGQVVISRTFAEATSSRSLLICGTTLGKLLIWTVPWDGGDINLIAQTPPSAKIPDNSPIVDIKVGSTGPVMLITLSKSGCLNVWHLDRSTRSLSGAGGGGGAGAAKKKGIMTRIYNAFFSKSDGKTSQNNSSLAPIAEAKLTLMFSLTSLDTTHAFPSTIVPPGLYDDIVEQREKKDKGKRKKQKTAGADASRHAVNICFHPSISILGKNCSFMVGTASGDLVKYNMDWLVPTMDCEIVYPVAPFVNREYIHPDNAPEGFVLSAGLSDRKGNQVFRELFHFHKEKIIFMEMMQSLSECIISIDASGLVAIWEYNKSFFDGMYWFRPSFTARLNLDVNEFLTEERTAVVGQNACPTVQQEHQLQLRHTFVSAENDEEYKTSSRDGGSEGDEGRGPPVKGGSRAVSQPCPSVHCDIYYPIYHPGLQRYVQFESRQRIMRTVKSAAKISPVSTVPLLSALPTPRPPPPPQSKTATTATEAEKVEAVTKSSAFEPEKADEENLLTVHANDGGISKSKSSAANKSKAGTASDEKLVATINSSASSAEQDSKEEQQKRKDEDHTNNASPDAVATTNSASESASNAGDDERKKQISRPNILERSSTSNLETVNHLLQIQQEIHGDDSDDDSPRLIDNDNLVDDLKDLEGIEDDDEDEQDKKSKKEVANVTETGSAETTVTKTEAAEIVADGATTSDGNNNDSKKGSDVVAALSAQSEVDTSKIPAANFQKDFVGAVESAVDANDVTDTADGTTLTDLNKDRKPEVDMIVKGGADVAIGDKEESALSTAKSNSSSELPHLEPALALAPALAPAPAQANNFGKSIEKMPSDHIFEGNGMKEVDIASPSDAEKAAAQRVASEASGAASLQAVNPSNIPFKRKAIRSLPNVKERVKRPETILSYSEKEWKYSVVTETVTKFKVLSCKMSNDGLDTVFLLKQNVHDGDGDPNSVSSRVNSMLNAESGGTSTLYIFAVLMMDSKKFHTPFPRLSLKTGLGSRAEEGKEAAAASAAKVRNKKKKDDNAAASNAGINVGVDLQGEGVIDFCMGPVRIESLTRALFVLTSERLVRAFSLHTGDELLSSVFPFNVATHAAPPSMPPLASGPSSPSLSGVIAGTATSAGTGAGTVGSTVGSTAKHGQQGKYASFVPSTISLCPSQRVLTLSAADDTRVAVFVFAHDDDGKETTPTITSAHEAAKEACKDGEASAGAGWGAIARSMEFLKAIATKTVLDEVVPPEYVSPFEADAMSLVRAIVDNVFAFKDAEAWTVLQKARIAALFGDELGVIEPTVWPPTEEYKERARGGPSLDSEDGDEDVDDDDEDRRLAKSLIYEESEDRKKEMEEHMTRKRIWIDAADAAHLLTLHGDEKEEFLECMKEKQEKREAAMAKKRKLERKLEKRLKRELKWQKEQEMLARAKQEMLENQQSKQGDLDLNSSAASIENNDNSKSKLSKHHHHHSGFHHDSKGNSLESSVENSVDGGSLENSAHGLSDADGIIIPVSPAVEEVHGQQKDAAIVTTTTTTIT